MSSFAQSISPKNEPGIIKDFVTRLINVLPNFKELDALPTKSLATKKSQKDTSVVILSDCENSEGRKFLKSSIEDTLLFEKFLFAASEEKLSESQTLTIFYKISLPEGVWHFRLLRKGMRYDSCEFVVDFNISGHDTSIKVLNSKLKIAEHLSDRGLEHTEFFTKLALGQSEKKTVSKELSERFITEIGAAIKAAPGIRDESSERVEISLKRSALKRFIYSGTALRTLSRDEQELIDSYTKGNNEQKSEILKSLNLKI